MHSTWQFAKQALRSLIAALLLFGNVPVAAQVSVVDPIANGSANAAPIVDTRVRLVHDKSKRMTVSVMVGGRPLSFLIDTGAERSGVASEIAHAMQLRPMGERTVVSFAGRQLVPSVELKSLQYTRDPQAAVEALLFDRGVIGADGIIGIDMLAGQRVDFDFVRQRMHIRRASRMGMFTTRQATVVRASRRPGRMIFSNASINGVRTDVLIDTGSNVTIGNAALFERLRAKRRLGPTVKVMMQAVTGAMLRADYGITRNVTIGDVFIQTLPVAFATTEPFDHLGLDDRPAVLLGMDALRLFGAVTIDFRSRQVRFTPREGDWSTPEMRLSGHRFS